jgi:hypothetical protein
MTADLLALVATAARVMPAWSAASAEHGAYLNGPGGAKLHLEQPWNRKGYVSVSGCYPITSMRPDHVTIAVRTDRGAGILAREIRRRLLPGYLAELAKVTAHNAAEQHDTGLRLALAGKIRALFADGESHMPGHCQSEGRTEIVISLGDLRGGWLKMHGNASEIEFERFRAPADIAVAMLAALAEGMAGKP